MSIYTIYVFLFIFILTLFSSVTSSDYATSCEIPNSDIDVLEFPLNLKYLEAEFFLHASLGHGLDKFAPNVSMGGPPPIGARKAHLDALVKDVIEQFAWQEVGHLRAVQKISTSFPRPLLDLSAISFAKLMDQAFGHPLSPPFDPYANSINFLIASYIFPYLGLTGYVGSNAKLQGACPKRVAAGLMGCESGQDAVLRALLYERRKMKVKPYNLTVAEFTKHISKLRNKLGHEGWKDEGIVVPAVQGAEGKIEGNILAGDEYSIAYERTPQEMLRILYGGGDERTPGGFFPEGANGNIAKYFLKNE